MSNVSEADRSSLKVGWVLFWTALWITVLASEVIAAFLLDGKCPSGCVARRSYLQLVWGGAVVMIALFFFGLYRAYASRHVPWYTDTVLVTLVIFWALFPPSFFFVDYYATDMGLMEYPRVDGTFLDRETALKNTQEYSDAASKIWAAASATFAGTLAALKRSG